MIPWSQWTADYDNLHQIELANRKLTSTARDLAGRATASNKITCQVERSNWWLTARSGFSAQRTRIIIATGRRLSLIGFGDTQFKTSLVRNTAVIRSHLFRIDDEPLSAYVLCKYHRKMINVRFRKQTIQQQRRSLWRVLDRRPGIACADDAVRACSGPWLVIDRRMPFSRSGTCRTDEKREVAERSNTKRPVGRGLPECNALRHARRLKERSSAQVRGLVTAAAEVPELV